MKTILTFLLLILTFALLLSCAPTDDSQPVDSLAQATLVDDVPPMDSHGLGIGLTLLKPFAPGECEPGTDLMIYTSDAPYDMLLADVSVVIKVATSSPGTITILDDYDGALSDSFDEATTGRKRVTDDIRIHPVGAGSTVKARCTEYGASGWIVLDFIKSE